MVVGWLLLEELTTTTYKIVWDGVVSTPKVKYMYIDIKINYLGTPLTRYDYLRISIILITDQIIQ